MKALPFLLLHGCVLAGLALASFVPSRCLGSAGTSLLYPVVSFPEMTVFHQAYAPDSPKLKSVLAGSKGDFEAGTVTLAVSEYSLKWDYYYRGYRMAIASITKFDPRTGTYSSLSTQVNTDPAGHRESIVDTDPMQIMAERRSYYCRSASGDTSDRLEIKSKCMLIHQVTRPARSPQTHAWNAVTVGMVFFTNPEPVDCNPISRIPRSLKFEIGLGAGEIREFTVDAAGFKDEACEDPATSLVYFSPIAIAQPIPVANAQ
jgi:hypothetical protein